MKKAAKITAVVCGAAVLLFLLLPFLETTAPTQAGTQEAKKASPQIFTSNPLTDLVNRIARFFGAKNAAGRENQTLTAQQAAEQFGSPVENAAYADARAASGPVTAEAPSAGGRASSGNAYFQNEDGDWVLIRQTAPEGVTPGMHEINVKDNAYDSYVRQERAARFTPAAQTHTKTQEVPDSKLARLFNPIKRFFGFSDAQAVTSADWIADGKTATAGALGSSDGLGKNGKKTVSSHGRGTSSFDMPEPAGPYGAGDENVSFEKGRSRETVLSLTDVDTAINDIAQWVADQKFPNPQTPQENDAKEQEIQKQKAFMRALSRQKMQEHLIRTAAENGSEPVELDIGGCAISKPKPIVENLCGDAQEQDSTDTPPEQMQRMQDANQASFLQKTGKLPPALMPLTVIVSKFDDPKAIMDNRQLAEETAANPDYPNAIDNAETMKIYEFMVQQQDCASSSCYWVANSTQQTPDLKDEVNGTGLVTFKGDPLNKYDQIKQQYTQRLLDELGEDATEEQKQEAMQKADKYAPPHVLYTIDDLKQVQAHNREVGASKDPSRRGETAAFYVSSAADGVTLLQEGMRIKLYGKKGETVNATYTHPTIDLRAEELTNDLADQINFFSQMIKELKQDAMVDVTKHQLSPKVEQIQKQAAQDRKDFDKANDLGQAERGQ